METRMYRRDHTDKQGPQAAHEARQTRRAKRARQIRRRRSACTLTLTSVLAGTVMLVVTAGAPAAQPPDQAVLIVTTGADVPVGTSDGATVLSACLARTTPEISSVGLGAVIKAIDDAEEALRDPDTAVENAVKDTDAEDVPQPTGQSVKTDLDDKCSFRMALHVANALGAVELGNGTEDTAGTLGVTIGFEGVKNLDLVQGTPLPPILGDMITINGCEDGTTTSPPASAAPCVNLDLDGTGSIAPDLLRDQAPSPSVVPELPVGLIAAGQETTIKGMSFTGDIGTAVLALSPPFVPNTAALAGKLTVQNSWFGRKAPMSAGSTGTQQQAGDAPDVGIQLSGRNAVIGGTKSSERNVFSAADVGVLIAGGRNNQILGNLLGTDPAGTPLTSTSKGRLGAGIQLRGLGVPADFYTRMVERAAGVGLVEVPITRQASGNTIGATIDAGAGPATANGSGPCKDNGCNVFAGIDGTAIEIGGPPLTQVDDVDVDTGDTGDTEIEEVNPSDILGLTRVVNNVVPDVDDVVEEADTVGVDKTEILSNRIGFGLQPSSTPKDDGIEEVAIRVRNGAKETDIGGLGLAESGNVISNSGDSGVVLDGATDLVTETGAGLDTLIAHNVGFGFGKNETLIDLGGDGKGNDADGPSGGIQAPQITSASPTRVSGTAAPESEINVYRVMSTNGYGDVDAHVGEADADEDGNWSAKVSGVTGRQVTATADLVGTSELADNVTVVTPTAPVIDTGGSDPLPTIDQTAPAVKSVLGKDPEAGPVVVKKAPKQFEGEVSDESGVAQVKVALQIIKLAPKSRKAAPKGKGKGGKGKAPKCKYVHLSKGKMLKRPCDAPPFSEAETEATSDGASWEVPLSKKAQKRLRPGRYLLHIQTVDTKGNVANHSVPLRRKG